MEERVFIKERIIVREGASLCLFNLIFGEFLPFILRGSLCKISLTLTKSSFTFSTRVYGSSSSNLVSFGVPVSEVWTVLAAVCVSVCRIAVILIRSSFISATSLSISWLEAAVGWMMGGVINGGDFN